MSKDAITDQSLTVLECRALLETFLSAPLPASTLHRAHKKVLKQLKQKALRGAAMETPDETRVRLQKKEMFHVEQ
jgi:hypothetical protein